MAASKHINPDQLRLFMTPQEILNEFEPLPGDTFLGESHEDVWDRKSQEAQKSGLTQSIREKGIQVPVALSPDPKFPQVMGGHHRIAAARDIDPNMHIPVTYEDSSLDAAIEEIKTAGRHGLWGLPNTAGVRKDPNDDSNSNSNSNSDEW